MPRVEQTCADHDPALPLPSPSCEMAVGGDQLNCHKFWYRRAIYGLKPEYERAC